MKKKDINKTNAKPARDVEACLDTLNINPQSLQAVFSKLLLFSPDWQSIRCSLSWKVKKTNSGRLYPKLLASRNETDMLPTVVAVDSSRSGEIVIGRRKVRESEMRFSANLCDLAKSGLLPTPSTGANRNSRNAVQKIGKTHQNHDVDVGLAQAIELSSDMLPKEFKSWSPVPYMYRLLPTPTARDHKGGRHPDSLANVGRKASNSLNDAINAISGACCKLNPLFIAEMMGFPVNWMLEPFQNKNFIAAKTKST